MGAALLIARSWLRRNLAASVVLVVLAGLGGGVVLAATSGMRRADRAWSTLQAEHPEADALALLVTDGEEDDGADGVEVIQHLPGVTSATRATAAVGFVQRPGADTRTPVAANVWIDPPGPDHQGRPIIVAGRQANPSEATEAVVDEDLADRHGLGVGDPLELTPFRYEELEAASDGRDLDPAGDPTVLTVVGVVRQPNDLLPRRTDQHALYSDEPFLELTPAWWAATGPDVGNYGIFVTVDLDAGPAGFPAYAAALDEALDGQGIAIPGSDGEIGITAAVRRAVDRQIAMEGRALAAFAVAAAVAAVAILALALFRQLGVEAADRASLTALGVTRGGVVAAALVRSLAVAVGAAVVAVGVAVTLSARLPLGVGGRTVRHRGIDVDEPVLALGGAVVAAVVLGLAALASWRTGRARVRPARPVTVADRVASLGSSPAATVGVGMAFDRTVAAAAGRAAIATGALAVGAALAAASVTGSLAALRQEPARLGQAWDASAGNFASETGLAKGLDLAAGIDGVEAVAGEMQLGVASGDEPFTAVAYVPFIDRLNPVIRTGRAPDAPDEVVLGAALARSLGAEIGDRVPVEVPFLPDPIDLEVTGIGVVGAMGGDVDPGGSALVDDTLLERDPDNGVSVLLVRFADDADEGAVLAELREQFPLTVLRAPVPPRAVQTFTGLAMLPPALAATIGLLAVAAAANALVTSIRRRRRDLAILKALGFERGQVARAVAWQASTWSVVALLIGVPLGLLLGAIGWRAVTHSLGMASPTILPALAVAGSVLGAVSLANAVAAWPGRAAAGTAPAVALRAE